MKKVFDQDHTACSDCGSMDWDTGLDFKKVEHHMSTGFFRSVNHRPSTCESRIGGPSRLILSSIVLLLITAAQLAAQTGKKPTIEERELITGDELKIKITYYKAAGGADSPVVILLHGKKGSRQQWKNFASDLQQKGDFAVVAVDLRGHGESLIGKKTELLKKADYQAMVGFDMEAVKDFLLDEHTKKNLNVNKLGIVGCDFSGSVALLFAELDWEKIPYDDSPLFEDKTPRGQDVQALVLVSPDPSTPGLVAHKAVMAARSRARPIVIGVADKNSHDVGIANKMFEQLSPKKDKEKQEPPYLWKYPVNQSGMDLVTHNPDFRSHISEFLTKYVKEHPSEWRDRRSRLDRD